MKKLMRVLDWPCEKARAVFGDDLERVLYCPVIEEKIPDLDAYVDDWLVANGFSILETNFPREMKSWLKDCEIKKGNNP